MDWMAFLAVVGTVSGIVLGWTARAREIKKGIANEAKEDAEAAATLQTDVAYIKRGIDDIKVDVRAQGQRVDCLSERVVRVEESAKQAHKRLHEIYKNKGG